MNYGYDNKGGVNLAVKYTNFRGDEYYLHKHEKKTSKGNIRYFFKKDDPSSSVDQIPEGYEIYEHPNGRVFLRKKLEQLVTDEEVDTIDEVMKEYSPIKDYKLDVKQRTVYIYTYENRIPFDENPLIVEALSDPKYKSYDTKLCFTLTDKETREFKVVRKSFIGKRNEQWMTLDESSDLKALAKKYVPHLGQESFYELF